MSLGYIWIAWNLSYFYRTNLSSSIYNRPPPLLVNLFLYPSHRGYISFVNTFVTHRNFDLRLGSLETFDQHEILRHLTYICLSVRPYVLITIASERKELRTSNFANKLLLAGRYCKSVHSIWYHPYKPNRYTWILGTWKMRFAPNLIFNLVY